MVLPPKGEPTPPPEPDSRPELLIVEAGASRERRCADCGQRVATWRPFLRRGLSVILCSDCATRAISSGDAAECPSCKAPLRLTDRFCGRCGTRIEYACPACAAPVDAEDVFCGRCGTRLS